MRRSTRSRSSQSSQEGSASQEEGVSAQQKKKSKKIPICKPSQWVAVLPDSMCVPPAEIKKSHSFISLPDPKTGAERQYLACPESCRICEVQKCTDEPRSWFIGETVQTDGCLLVCTPVDPLFLALPYLSKAAKSGKFTTLDAILDDPTRGNNSSQLETYIGSDQWKHVCDDKVLPGGLTVYRHNRTKTINWLRKKVESLAAQLEAQQVHVGPGSHSSTLVRSRKHDSVTKEDYLKYACGMTCEYLNEDMATALVQSYSFKGMKRAQEEPMEQPPPKRTGSVDSGFFSQQSSLNDDNGSSQELTCTPTAASSISDDSGPLEDYTKYNTSLQPSNQPTKAQKQTQAQKALAKADKKGMKSLSSFFGKTKT